MSEHRLLPCPFCGAKAALTKPDTHTYVYVICTKCGARGTIVKASHGGTYAEAAEAWNQRVPANELRETLDGLREYFAQRADAEYDAIGPIGNTEMRLLMEIDEALIKAGKTP